MVNVISDWDLAFDILNDIFHEENDRPDFTGVVRVMMMAVIPNRKRERKLLRCLI